MSRPGPSATSTPAKRRRKQDFENLENTIEIQGAMLAIDAENLAESGEDRPDRSDLEDSDIEEENILDLSDVVIEADDMSDGGGGDSDGGGDGDGGDGGDGDGGDSDGDGDGDGDGDDDDDSDGDGARMPRRRIRTGSATLFSWCDVEDFHPNVPVFDRQTGGIQDEFPVADNDAEEREYFEAFFDLEVSELICQQTNLFRETTERDAGDRDDPDDPDNPTPTTSRSKKRRKWSDLTRNELYVFFALLMLMGHVKKAVLRDYWIVEDLTSTPVFGKFMARDRFDDILRFLHFVDNATGEERRQDRLWKIRDLFTLLKDRFKAFMFPFQKLVIDESLVLFRGRVVFRQYIPSKRHRFGLKFFVICDCETGYVLDMVVYTASDVDIPRDPEHGFSGAVVKKLMDRYLDKNHILYTDNYYTSPLLSQYLLQHGTGSCGTVRKNRKHFPQFPKGRPGSVQLKKSNDNMLAIAWTDRRQVQLLSTVHEGKMKDSGKRDRRTNEMVKKPDAVLDYNINMRLVDKCDMQVGAIECLRKCLKWYKKMFMHLIDIVVLNAYNLWLRKTGKKASLRIFQKKIINQLLAKYGQLQPLTPRAHTLEGQPDRLLGKDYLLRHHLENLPPLASGRTTQRRCHVCSFTTTRPRKRKAVTMQCHECKVPLCLTCFVEYHSKKKY